MGSPYSENRKKESRTLCRFMGHWLTCLCVSCTVKKNGGPRKKSCIKGAFIFGRKEPTIVVKTISKKQRSFKKVMRQKKS